MTAVTAVLLSLSLLPHCLGYSITSSLGPSFEYGPFHGPSTGGSSSAGRLQAGATVAPSLAAQQQRSDNNNFNNNNERGQGRGTEEDGDDGSGSHYISVRDSGIHNRGPYVASFQEQMSPYSQTQLQVAGRILFESRIMTTAKPQLGYRSFLSSYRNPNYFMKKSKHDDGDDPYLSDSTLKHVYPEIGLEEAPKRDFYVDSTTPESKTASATAVFLEGMGTDRPSSTQQMQSDGSYLISTVTGSEHSSSSSSVFYFKESSGGQEPGTGAAAAPSKEPVLATNSGYETDTTVSITSSLGPSRGPEEVPIVFPATPKPSLRPVYKVPGEDLSGLKNILEQRGTTGGNITEESSSSSTKEVTSVSTSTSSSSSSKEKFSPVPDGVSDPSCATQLGYCDMNNFQDSYPKELINSVLSNSISSDLFKKVFGDVTDGPATKNSEVNNYSLMGRNNMNRITEETALCSSQEVTIYPRAAKNKDDKWMFIVNHDDYVQGVKVEKCMNEGRSCLFGEGNPLGYESVCRQKFILRKLVAVNNDGKTSLDTFKLPSCCVCFIKSNFISDRTGAMSSSASNQNQPPHPILSDKGSPSQLPDNPHELPFDLGSDSNNKTYNNNATESTTTTANKTVVLDSPSSNATRTTASLLPDIPSVNLRASLNSTSNETVSS